MNLGDAFDLLDRLDVPTLAVGVLYGFWKVVHLLQRIERGISDRLHAHELRIVKLETKGSHREQGIIA